jgi:hypothetical protein
VEGLSVVCVVALCFCFGVCSCLICLIGKGGGSCPVSKLIRDECTHGLQALYCNHRVGRFLHKM